MGLEHDASSVIGLVIVYICERTIRVSKGNVNSRNGLARAANPRRVGRTSSVRAVGARGCPGCTFLRWEGNCGAARFEEAVRAVRDHADPFEMHHLAAEGRIESHDLLVECGCPFVVLRLHVLAKAEEIEPVPRALLDDPVGARLGRAQPGHDS
jgi:hypothetical protein